MRLPHLALATVPERKITEYLLNPAHPSGGSKAAFFQRFGYSLCEWERIFDEGQRPLPPVRVKPTVEFE